MELSAFLKPNDEALLLWWVSGIIGTKLLDFALTEWSATGIRWYSTAPLLTNIEVSVAVDFIRPSCVITDA